MRPLCSFPLCSFPLCSFAQMDRRGRHFPEENPMTYAESILSEFDQEMASTRKVLERVPEDRLDWRAPPKANTIGWEPHHTAEIPRWAKGRLAAAGGAFAPVSGGC